MADEQPEADQTKQFLVKRIYIKDLSFESPLAPLVFAAQDWKPKTDISIKSIARPLQDNIFEVVLFVTATTSMNEQPAYLVELQQAGLFEMNGFDTDELGAVLGGYCPGLLFPFAREAIANVVVKGGFPPMLLKHVNFDTLYVEQQQRKAEEGEASETPAQE